MRRLFSTPLNELAGGNGWRAAGILVVAHLLPGIIMLALWLIGLAPVFDGAPVGSCV